MCVILSHQSDFFLNMEGLGWGVVKLDHVVRIISPLRHTYIIYISVSGHVDTPDRPHKALLTESKSQRITFPFKVRQCRLAIGNNNLYTRLVLVSQSVTTCRLWYDVGPLARMLLLHFMGWVNSCSSS